MPQIIGPGLLNRVLRDTVQGLVDSAVQIKQTFSILRTRQGDGDVVIRGIHVILVILTLITAVLFTRTGIFYFS